MTAEARETSLSVFRVNLRRILMTAPLRNTPLPCASDLNATASTSSGSCTPHGYKQHRRAPSPDVISSSLGAPGDRLPVLGLDPGWRHGTKWAACDPLGGFLAAGVIHVTLKEDHGNHRNDNEIQKMVQTMRDHG